MPDEGRWDDDLLSLIRATGHPCLQVAVLPRGQEDLSPPLSQYEVIIWSQPRIFVRVEFCVRAGPDQPRLHVRARERRRPGRHRRPRLRTGAVAATRRATIKHRTHTHVAVRADSVIPPPTSARSAPALHAKPPAPTGQRSRHRHRLWVPET